MPGDDVSTGELGRRLADVKSTLDRLNERMVTREVWQVEQQRITEWLARLEREHVALEVRLTNEVDKEAERRRSRNESDRQQRIADRRLVYGALLAGAASFLVAILTKLYGGA